MKQVDVVAALIPHPEEPGRYLVQQRPAHKSRGNLWEFPGGKVEPGEGDEAALVREGREELGVELAVGRRRWSTSHRYEDLEVTLRLYDAQIVSGTPAAHDAQALAFLTPGQMLERPFCAADLPLLELLASGQLG